jgi:hypothetical protein
MIPKRGTEYIGQETMEEVGESTAGGVRGHNRWRAGDTNGGAIEAATDACRSTDK